MNQKKGIHSESLEDYLECVRMLGGENVRSVDIANHLSVSKASVNKAVNVLMENGLVQKELYGDVSLTKKGASESERILKKHVLIRRFLIEVLGVAEEVAEKEACGIEHNIGEDTAKRLETLVGQLTKNQ